MPPAQSSFQLHGDANLLQYNAPYGLDSSYKLFLDSHAVTELVKRCCAHQFSKQPLLYKGEFISFRLPASTLEVPEYRTVSEVFGNVESLLVTNSQASVAPSSTGNLVQIFCQALYIPADLKKLKRAWNCAVGY